VLTVRTCFKEYRWKLDVNLMSIIDRKNWKLKVENARFK
jgi:hypothetical protein